MYNQYFFLSLLRQCNSRIAVCCVYLRLLQRVQCCISKLTGRYCTVSFELRVFFRWVLRTPGIFRKVYRAQTVMKIQSLATFMGRHRRLKVCSMYTVRVLCIYIRV